MRFLLSCLAGAVALALQATPAAADQVRFQLRDVRIDRQREESGDRPYFTALAFRVKLCNRREAPTVEVLEREPHDWVRFSEHNGGRLATDHMFRGSTVPVPTWMGQYTFNNVNITPLTNYIGDGASGRITQVEILGVAYFSFDNNNTPPHVIRGLMNQARGILQETLRSELQDTWTDDAGRPRGCGVLLNAVLTGNTTTLSNNLQSQLQAVAMRTIDGWRVAEVLFQLTAGSTFNSDQPTGVNIILVPSVTGLPDGFGDGLGSAVDYRLPTGSLLVQTSMMAPVNASLRLPFEGAGANYQSNFGLFVTRTSAATVQNATQVWLRIRTGGDDLRGGNDNVFASVRINGRWRPEVQLNRGGERWADNTTHDVMIPIGSTPVANIEAVRLRTTFGGGMGGDNWNMDSARIDWRGMGGIGGELANQGAKRFTGDDRELVIEFRR